MTAECGYIEEIQGSSQGARAYSGLATCSARRPGTALQTPSQGDLNRERTHFRTRSDALGEQGKTNCSPSNPTQRCVIGRVDLGGCPPRPPTDPDVRHSRIRFLRSTDSQPIAIRRSCGERPVGISVPCIGPSDEPVSRHSLPSTGSHRSVPPLPRYYETLRLPTTRSPTLRFLRVVGTVSRPTFAPSGVGRTRPKARSIGLPGSSWPGCSHGDGRASQVPGRPLSYTCSAL